MYREDIRPLVPSDMCGRLDIFLLIQRRKQNDSVDVYSQDEPASTIACTRLF